MLYRIRHDLVAIRAAVYLQPVPTCTRVFEARYMQIQCNTNTFSQSFFPHTISLWNTLSIDVCQLSPDSFTAWLSSSQFIYLSPVVFLSHRTSTVFIWFLFILLLLHCSTFTTRNCSLLAVRYCSVLSWHLFWKTKMICRLLSIYWPRIILAPAGSCIQIRVRAFSRICLSVCLSVCLRVSPLSKRKAA